MTREELRDYVDEQRELDNIPYHVYSALIDGIDTLEQEPCDDVVSREKVLEMITDFATLELYIDKHNHVTFEPLEKLIKSLPSVSTTKNIVNHGTMNITL